MSRRDPSANWISHLETDGTHSTASPDTHCPMSGNHTSTGRPALIASCARRDLQFRRGDAVEYAYKSRLMAQKR